MLRHLKTSYSLSCGAGKVIKEITMKKRGLYLTALLVFSSMLILSCTPAPTSPATSNAAQPTTAPAANQSSPILQADAAWQKVVDAAKKEGKLTIYSFTLIGDVGIATANAFTNRYGINVDIVTGRGAEFIERIKTEQRIGQVMVDVMEGNPTHILNVKANGHTISIKDVPVLKEKDAWRIDPLVNDSGGHLIGHRILTFSPLINTKLVKPADEPKSYKDILKPYWKGKISTGDPALTSADYVTFVTMLNHKAIDLEFLRALGNQDLKFFPGTVDSARALSRGEYAMHLSNSDSASASFIKEGAPLKPIPMEEGSVVQASTVAVIKNAPHPNAALVFVNWMATKEGQEVYTKAVGITSVRKDVPNYSPVPIEPKKVIAHTEEDANDVAKRFSEKFLVQLWKK